MFASARLARILEHTLLAALVSGTGAQATAAGRQRDGKHERIIAVKYTQPQKPSANLYSGFPSASLRINTLTLRPAT